MTTYAQTKAWRKAHPERYRLSSRIQKGIYRSEAFARYWPHIVAHYGPCPACVKAKRPIDLATVTVFATHVLPVFYDPLARNVLTNLQPLCQTCRAKRCDGVDDYRKDGGAWIAKLIENDPEAQRPLHRGKYAPKVKP